ncbi:MAG TPA: DUF502 domain-containing protein [Bacteroidota bacterium]|nr:DUF502 domain-containing protein [Bacteroidota bacterium]
MTGQFPKSLLGAIRTTFLRGIGVLIPLWLTFWFFEALLNAVDGILRPHLEQWIGYRVPGLGVVSVIVIILLVGLLTRNLFGRLFLTWFENFLGSIPVVRSVYSAIKELVSAFALGGKSKTFRQVVMTEYPRKGLYCIGFVTNEMPFRTAEGMTQDFLNVYIPNPPNPTSGFLVLIPREEAIKLDLSIEEGLKLVLSGGIVLPEQLTGRKLTPSERTVL